MIRKTVAVLMLLIILVGLVSQVSAALTKSTTVDTIDAWQSVSAGTMTVGNADSYADAYEAILYIELAPIEAVATDGANVIVEISYGDDLWVQLCELTATAETPGADDLDEGGGATAGDGTITLSDATTDDFDVIGRRWLIWDTGSVSNSEVVRTVSVSGNTVTLAQDLLNNHDDAEPVYDRVDQWIVHLPPAGAYVRVLVYNDDADCDCAFTTRISKLTGI